MEVILSPNAENKLEEITKYLLSEWGNKVKIDFLSKLTSKIDQISLQPESCPKSKELGGIYKCVVTKQNTFYYRINSQKNILEVIIIFDTRQNPNKLKKQLK
jgi:plasmid stabilization system protein ParE